MDLLSQMIAEQGGRCFYCRSQIRHPKDETRTVKIATKDHRIPKAQGGTSGRENLVAACRTCNQFKSNLPESVFVSILTAIPRDHRFKFNMTRAVIEAKKKLGIRHIFKK